jgi:hypothetical protein
MRDFCGGNPEGKITGRADGDKVTRPRRSSASPLKGTKTPSAVRGETKIPRVAVRLKGTKAPNAVRGETKIPRVAVRLKGTKTPSAVRGETKIPRVAVRLKGTKTPSVVNRPPEAGVRDGDVTVKPPGLDAEEAFCDTLAEMVAKPITDWVMLPMRPLEGNGENGATREGIDKTCKGLTLIADPARIPSAVVDKVVAHLTAHLLAATTLGPIGPVVAIFAGKFASELTHQALYGGRDAAGAQAAVDTIELTGAFADAQIGQLAESEPFREYVSGLISKPIAAIIDGDARAVPDQTADEDAGRPATITAVVAAYEVRSPAGGSGSTPRGGPVAVRVRPASFAALACIPKGAVTARFTSVSHEFLLLADGTLVKRRRDGASRRRWVQVSDWPGAKDPQEAKELLSRRGYQVVHLQADDLRQRPRMGASGSAANSPISGCGDCQPGMVELPPQGSIGGLRDRSPGPDSGFR